MRALSRVPLQFISSQVFARRSSVVIVVVLLGFVANAPIAAQDAPRTVHVFVALADNQYQGIVPVPAKLGNGTDPERNLYWGSAYGIKTFLPAAPTGP